MCNSLNCRSQVQFGSVCACACVWLCACVMHTQTNLIDAYLNKECKSNNCMYSEERLETIVLKICRLSKPKMGSLGNHLQRQDVCFWGFGRCCVFK